MKTFRVTEATRDGPLVHLTIEADGVSTIQRTVWAAKVDTVEKLAQWVIDQRPIAGARDVEKCGRYEVETKVTPENWERVESVKRIVETRA